MPLYLVYCPDTTGGFEARMRVREAHVAASAESKQAGTTRESVSGCVCDHCSQSPHPPATLITVFGRAFVNDQKTHHRSQAPMSAKEQHDGMAGSVMIYRFANIEDCWDRIKRDAYWTNHVWDHDRIVVREIIGAEGDEALQLVMRQ